MLSLKENDVNVSMAMLLWQMWRDKNDAIWKDKMYAPNISICLAANASDE